MDEKKLSDELKMMAVSAGLCAEWTENWGNPDYQGMIDKYLHGIDFCIGHDYPGVEYIKRNFDRELLHANLIFADEEVHLRNARGKVVLNGKCRGSLLFDGMTVCDLYVLHDSDVLVDCRGMCKVFVNLYGHGKATVMQHGASSVYVYRHGCECLAETTGDVMLRHSER